MAQIEIIKTDGAAITKGPRRFDPTATLEQYDGDWAAYRAAMVANGKDFWLPVVRNPQPSFDPETQHPPEALPAEIQATQVVYDWAAPVNKTPAELDAELDAVVARMDSNRNLIKALALTLFEVVNQVRVLNNQGEITLPQFRNYLKGKL